FVVRFLTPLLEHLPHLFANFFAFFVSLCRPHLFSELAKVLGVPPLLRDLFQPSQRRVVETEIGLGFATVDGERDSVVDAAGSTRTEHHAATFGPPIFPSIASVLSPLSGTTPRALRGGCGQQGGHTAAQKQ